MMLFDGPKRTKNVPIIEAMMAMAPIASGNIMIVATSEASRNRMEPSTIVATVVTA